MKWSVQYLPSGKLLTYLPRTLVELSYCLLSFRSTSTILKTTPCFYASRLRISKTLENSGLVGWRLIWDSSMWRLRHSSSSKRWAKSQQTLIELSLPWDWLSRICWFTLTSTASSKFYWVFCKTPQSRLAKGQLLTFKSQRSPCLIIKYATQTFWLPKTSTS